MGRVGEIGKARLVADATPGLRLGERLEVVGAEPVALLSSLEAEICKGGLLRRTASGWALDFAEMPGAPPLWEPPGPPAEPGPGPLFPTDEQGAATLRLLDAVALGLGLGRGHVLGLYENPARRAIEMQAFCDLPTLSREAVQERVAAFLDLGVPVAGVLGLRAEAGGGWTAYRPALRWHKLLLSPNGTGLRARLPEEVWPAGDDGYGLLLARPLQNGIAVDLPAGFDLDALSQLLGALGRSARNQDVRLLVEGEVCGPGLVSLGAEPEAGGRLVLTLPALPAPERSGALMAGVVECLGGARLRPGGRRATARLPDGAGRAGLHRLLATALRHPVLTRIGRSCDVGPWSRARRPEEQPGDAGTALAAMLAPGAPPPPEGALAACLSGTEFGLDESGLSLLGGPSTSGAGTGGPAARAWQSLVAAATRLQPRPAQAALPIGLYTLPAILEEDLEAILVEAASDGIDLPAEALRAALAAGAPCLGEVRAGAGVLGARRALLERRLPGDWAAMAFEIRVAGVDGPVRLAARAIGPDGGGPWRAVAPVARPGLHLGRLAVASAPASTGPCAGLFPPDAVEIAACFDGEAAALRLTPAAAAEPAQPPECWPVTSAGPRDGAAETILGL